MSREQFSAPFLEQLTSFDTPTICNGLEEVLGKERPLNCTVRPLFCAHPNLRPIVGFARTATIRTRVPSTLSAQKVLEKRLSYYAHIVEAPHPTVTVIQDLDNPAAQGAWWGEVHTAVHKALGSTGCVTNGAIRDLDAVAPGFQLIAGGTSPSHGFAHVVDVACRVEIHGMFVKPGDLIHADRHGAVVIPDEAVSGLIDAIDRIAQREKLLLDAAKNPGFGVDAIREALSRGKDIH